MWALLTTIPVLGKVLLKLLELAGHIARAWQEQQAHERREKKDVEVDAGVDAVLNRVRDDSAGQQSAADATPGFQGSSTSSPGMDKGRAENN